MALKGDHTEPQEILRLVAMAKPQLKVEPLNAEGWADYTWDAQPCECHGFGLYNLERKTTLDCLDIPSIEMQLANQLNKHPGVHHRLVIEGVIEPAAVGMLMYSKAIGKNMFMGGLKGNTSGNYKKIMSWVAEVNNYMEVFFTATMPGTASLITALYDHDMKPVEEHGTFHRMFKEFDYNPNPYVQVVLNAGPKGFGVKAAEAVIAHFGTPWEAWRSEPEEWVKIPGVGELTANLYLRHIGRKDV